MTATRPATCRRSGPGAGVRYDTTRTSVITLVDLADEEVQVQPRAFEELEHLGDVLGDSRYDRGDAGRPVRLAAHG